MRQQQTIQKEVSFSGIGVHSGQSVYMRFLPAEENRGIVFQRLDLPHQPIFPVSIEYVRPTPRCTTLGKDGESIFTVEHVLAAIRAYNIDNLVIQLSAPEPPIVDGSAYKFVEMLEEAGIFVQQDVVQVCRLEHPVFCSFGETHLIALPSDTYRISYTLDYPNSKMIRSQYYSVEVSAETFKQEIAPCRTFALYEEIVFLLENGLIQGGSLENAVVIKEGVIFSKDGLRFHNEMARHKILDLIGDLVLVGYSFLAHIIAIRSGHQTNCALAKLIHQQLCKDHYVGV